MPDTIYWYDFETTGTDPVVDRPLQFAGVRTDLDLNEVEDPHNFLCRPGRDVLPNPEALLVTGIRMSQIESAGISEREFTARILEIFSEPQTCVAGFNSLRFDDEFTRQMLYRNFSDPYAREWQSGNSRWDVIDLFRAAYALRPEGFSWPEKDDGAPSFRLEDLARANGLPHLDAHDALADVRATIEVVRKLRAAQPRLYDYAYTLRDKKQVLRQLYPLGKNPVVHVSAMFPATRACTALVLPLCQHPTNTNAIICFDLSQPIDLLARVNAEELHRLVFTRQEELDAVEERIALKTIHINRAPFVAPLSTLDEAAALRIGLDKSVAIERRNELVGTAGLVEKIQEAFARSSFLDQDDPDFQLYQGGFFSDADRRQMQVVVQASPDQLSGYKGSFQDDRLDEMLFRYRCRNFPETLSTAELERWNEFRVNRWQNTGTLESRQSDITRLEEHAEQRDLEVLADLSRYLESIGAEVRN